MSLFFFAYPFSTPMIYEATPYVAAGAAVLLSGAIACESNRRKGVATLAAPHRTRLTPPSTPTDSALPKSHSQREKALLK